ncbi:MAG: hypothetical protein ACKVX7_12795 [Planctomycetota bacterium]
MVRLVLLGASNLTKGFAELIETARHGFGGPVEIFAALGLGRSYGCASSVFGRGLPGIAPCALWQALDREPARPTYALLCDFGNDLPYGIDVARILSWIEICVVRLKSMNARLQLTSLPIERLTRLSRLEFDAFARVFYPDHRPEFAATLACAHALDRGVRELALQHGSRLVELTGASFGWDPIHLRSSARRELWRDVVSAWGARPTPTDLRPTFSLRWRCFRVRPLHWSRFGEARTTPQPAALLADGTVLRLY